MAPLIAVSTYREPARWGSWEVRAPLLHEWYVDALAAAGADVALAPPGGGTAVAERADGLVLVGGADVDARLYGAGPDPTADAPRIDRDDSELRLYAVARARGLPVLGICRGLQIMAVAHGGALHQNLPDIPGTTVHREAPGTFTEHEARFAPGSILAEAYGTERLTVNSSHHQAVAKPGTLSVIGWASDDTIEACADPSALFVVGVQWHPEHPDRRLLDAPLFAAFVQACRG